MTMLEIIYIKAFFIKNDYSTDSIKFIALHKSKESHKRINRESKRGKRIKQYLTYE